MNLKEIGRTAAEIRAFPCTRGGITYMPMLIFDTRIPRINAASLIM